jgi:mRNA interferase MazF
MKRGTIVLTPFPFTDLSTIKRRPAIVVSKTNETKPDVIVAFISSVLPSVISETDLYITISDERYRNLGLKQNSVIKLDKLATIKKSIFTGELGYANPEIMRKIDLKLRIALDLKD